MSRSKKTRAIETFRQLATQIRKLSALPTKKTIDWLLRSSIVMRQQQSNAAPGFVLPTVTMLLLVMALVIAAILFRTGSRTNQVIGQREEQVIYNAATPAIERAKAKLEYLFRKDNRFPSGPPSDEMLLSMLTNNPGLYNPPLTVALTGSDANVYMLPDETEYGYLNIDNAGSGDPAWAYRIDVDGDGTQEIVVYSIVFKKRDVAAGVDIRTNSDQQKANALVVRNGPMNTIDNSNAACARLLQPTSPSNPNQGNQPRQTDESAWESVGTASLRKTFQVNAIVISNKPGTKRTVATLEFQQDRQIDRGNKWGAWFRNDLEIFPGNAFQWNGAMYTAGNLIVGGNNFTSRLISSERSCFYTRDASEIPVGDIENPRFQGQIISGKIGDNNTDGGSFFHVMQGTGRSEPVDDNTANTPLNENTDSVNGSKQTLQMSLDPVALLTQDISRARGGSTNNLDARDPNWERQEDQGGQIGYFRTRRRFFNQREDAPFVDDTYRADDRYGPKPAYGRITDTGERQVVLGAGGRTNGANITDPTDQQLLTNSTVDPLDSDFMNLGLDGYWERRAWLAGLRVLVGERLQLGNPFGWDAANDPLLPPNQTISHEARQRRTLRDNLAAVQGTVVYHNANGTLNGASSAGDAPVACIATTAHPGTQVSRNRSRDFRPNADANANINYTFPGETATTALVSDFFFGRGTNGWEFAPPPGIATGTRLTALQNLARFAGDLEGAFPPQQQGGQVNPDPTTTMWGNFSNLRRAVFTSNNSIADKSYIHTASCTLGILAYNINYFNNYAYNAADLTDLSADIRNLLTRTASPVAATATPDEILLRLREAGIPAARYRLARYIYMKEQIARDRANGATASVTDSYEVVRQDTNSDGDFTDPNETISTPVPTATATTGCALRATIGTTDALRSLAKLCPAAPKFPVLNAVFPTANAPAGNAIVTDLSQIALEPIRSVNDWRTPRTSTLTNRVNTIMRPDANAGAATDFNEAVGFLDEGIFNSREMLTVRTLVLDLDLLRNNTINGATWLPGSGIVYAFREDAVREDGIARPAGGAIPTGSTIAVTDARNPNSPTDPALINGLSPKAVDYYADPDRRPHGFRLRRGQNISRGTENNRGLSFISDNPVYIQGDFNYHSTNGTSNNLEEFTESIDNTPFYDRSTLQEDFARPSTDTWRPSEIVSDSITLLSDAFQAGNIASGIQNDASAATTGATGGRYSFRAMNRPTGTAIWVREDNSVDATSPFPIKLSRNGTPFVCPAGAGSTVAIAGAGIGTSPITICNNPQLYAGAYQPFGTNHRPDINPAIATRVNAMLVSGIVPSRQNQSYGGFHNFPRFIESWGSTTNMIIAGSFIQLNFSAYGTAPYEQDAWEPGAAPQGDANLNFINYYEPPGRRWGYDVGLQYAPAGPVAKRLLTPARGRSEFYRDLRADDPYVCKLRRALNNRNGQIDPASQQECQ